MNLFDLQFILTVILKIKTHSILSKKKNYASDSVDFLHKRLGSRESDKLYASSGVNKPLSSAKYSQTLSII